MAGCARRRGGRLVVRLWLFCGRALLGRRCLSGRGRRFCAAAAPGSDPVAGRPGAVLRRRRRARAAPLAHRALPRPRLGARALGHGICARASLHRLSLERAGLCADLPLIPDAKRRADRHLRADVARRPDLGRPPGALGRGPARPHGTRAAALGAGTRRCARPGVGDLGSPAARRGPRGHAAWGQAAHRAAERIPNRRSGGPRTRSAFSSTTCASRPVLRRASPTRLPA
jgi:hypothetical protein